MKRILEKSASTDTAAVSALIPDAALPTSGVVDAHRATRASNDANRDAPISAIDALAACMADSTFGG